MTLYETQGNCPTNARVSTTGQDGCSKFGPPVRQAVYRAQQKTNLDAQLAALTDAGVDADRVFTDKLSG
jgi:hypothetical protein